MKDGELHCTRVHVIRTQTKAELLHAMYVGIPAQVQVFHCQHVRRCLQLPIKNESWKILSLIYFQCEKLGPDIGYFRLGYLSYVMTITKTTGYGCMILRYQTYINLTTQNVCFSASFD
jgi:hypothetical protein